LAPPALPGITATTRWSAPVPHNRYSIPHGDRRSRRSLSTARTEQHQPRRHPDSHRHFQGDRFPRSAQEPEPSSRRLHAGHHLANTQAPARLIPGSLTHPGFDAIYPLRHFHSGSLAFVFIGSHLKRSNGVPFPQRSPPRLLTDAACGGLKPPPAGRLRRAKPPSLAQLRTIGVQRSSTSSSTSSCSWHTSNRVISPG
jgi:hypothetical protein